MSEIKKIAGHPENTLSLAMEKCLTAEERRALKETIMKLDSYIGKSEKGEKKTTEKKLPTKQELFRQHIIPIIKEGVRKLEELEDRGTYLEIEINVNFRLDFDKMTLDELTIQHKHMTEMENNVQTVDNFLKFYRGAVYMTVHRRFTPEEFTKWIKEQRLSTTTVYKYMTFAAFVMRCPRIIMCDLNFSQIVTHKERILAYITEPVNTKLAHQLSDSVEFRFGETIITINNCDSTIPHVKGVSASSADWRILDQYEKVDLTGINPVQTDGAMSMRPSDDMDELMRSFSLEEKKTV